MSLATSCPSCGTVFRVVQDQLKVSEGWVRCGHCQEVFNALEGLFDLSRRDTTTPEPSPDLAVPATSNPNDPAWMETRPAMFSDGRVLRERQEALQQRTTTPPVSAPTAAPTRVEISTRRAATWDPSVQEPERGMAPTQPDPGAWRTTSADTSLPAPALPAEEFLRGSSFADPVPDSLLGGGDFDAPAPGDETAYPATTLEFRSEAFGALAAARLRRDGRQDVDLPLDMPTAPAPLAPAPAMPEPPAPAAPAAAPAAQTSVAVPNVTAPEPATAPALAGPERTPPVSPAADSNLDLEKTLDLSATPVTAAPPPSASTTVPAPVPVAPPPPVAPEDAVMTPLSPSKQAADSVFGAIPLPEFVRRADSQARWHRPIVRAGLGIVALLLAGLLMAQAARHWHDLIATRWPATQPLLAHACQWWQCQLQAPQQLDALVVDSTTLSRPPNAAGYLLGVTLRNRASHAVAAPHIELSLTDIAGAVVLRRVLSPAEFRQGTALAAQSEASWSLEFTSANQRIAGYTLAAFYP